MDDMGRGRVELHAKTSDKLRFRKVVLKLALSREIAQIKACFLDAPNREEKNLACQQVVPRRKSASSRG